MGEQRKALILLLILVSLAVSITDIKVIKAQPKTLVVPDDYPTIADAISNATDGDTVFVKKGTYDGPLDQTLVINKTISFVGEDPETTILRMHPKEKQSEIPFDYTLYYEDSIAITANYVKLSGFTIISIARSETQGQALRVVGDTNTLTNNIIQTPFLTIVGSHNNIIKNTVYYMSVIGSFNNIAGNTVSKDGAFNGLKLESSFNTIQNNSVSSIMLNNATSNTITNNICERIQLGFSGASCSHNVISGNKMDGNRGSQYGGILISVGSYNMLYNNSIANFNNDRYGIALNALLSGNNTLYHNNFVNNSRQVYIYNVDDGGNPNFWDENREGNYWSDYNGTDADGDGIGDTPYVIDENNQDNYPLLQPVPIAWYPQPDTTPPSFYIISPQERTYGTDTVSLLFAVNEETSWMGYSLDGQNNVTLTEEYANLTGLSNSSHTIRVYANDTDGNMGTSTTVNFNVDNTPPTVTVLTPKNTTYSTSEIPLNFTVNEQTSRITYCLDGQENVTISGNITLTGLPNGNHNVTVYIDDMVQNTGASETITFTINKPLPVISILAPENITYSIFEVTLNFTINEDILEIMYCLDGQSNMTINGNTTLTGLTNGVHTLMVYATDTSGNTGKSETIVFTVAKEPDPEPTQLEWTPIALAAAIGAVAVAAIITYRGRKNQQKQSY